MKPLLMAGARIVVLCSLFLLAFSLVASAAPPGQIQLGYANGDDWEPALAADNFGHVYVLWPHYGGVPGCPNCPSPTALLQVSSDRGQTWSSPRVVTPDNLGDYQVDTQIVVDPVDGKTLYAAWLQNNKSDTVVTKSTDFGQTWSTPVVADSTNAGTDKPVLVARGNDVYVGFNHAQKVWVAASHDGGATFTSTQIRKNSEFGWSLAGGAAIDSQGNVYYSWAGYTQNGGAKGPVNLYVSKSSDGGATWTNTLIDVSASPPDCSAYKCGWAYLGAQAVITADAKNTLYVLWNSGVVDKGPERIYFARSTDGGATWSMRQDVSTAPDGTDHAFPTMTSGGADDVRIAWMDSRNAPMWNVYYRASSDGGATWSNETQLSSYVAGYSYLDQNGFAFPYGDYFGMDVDDRGASQVVWGEGPNWTGPGNIWYTRASH
jgi:Neuraminidase (sialidase)